MRVKGINRNPLYIILQQPLFYLNYVLIPVTIL